MGDQQFKAGDFVVNPKLSDWGTGQIVEPREQGKVLVNFQNAGQKVMLATFLSPTEAPKSGSILSLGSKGKGKRVKNDNNPLTIIRNDPDEAGKVMAGITSSRSDLELLMSLLVTSIGIADKAAPTAWSVTFNYNGYRLNVGGVEVMYYLDYTLMVNFVGNRGVSPFVGRNFYDVNYASISAPQCTYNGVVSDYAPLRESLAIAHRKFIELAATKHSGGPREGCTWGASHSEGLVRFAQMVCSGER